MSEDLTLDTPPDDTSTESESGPTWLTVQTARVWGAIALIVVLGLAAYWNSLGIPPLVIDEQLLLETNALHQVTTAVEAAGPEQPPVATLISLALNWQLAGGSIAGLRVGSIALHILTGILIVLLCRSLFADKLHDLISMTAGLLFVLHPVATESVHILANRGGILATLFMVLSLVLYLRATREKDRLAFPSFAGALVAFALAFAFRSAALALPVLVLASDWVVRGPSGWRKRAPLQGAYWALLVVLVAVQLAAVEGPAFGERTGSLLDQFGAFWTLLVPVITGRGLSLVHPKPEFAGLFDFSAVIAIGVTVVLIAVGVIMTVRRSPLGLAFLWFSGVLLLTGFLPDHMGLMSEQRVYPALAGAVFVLPWVGSLIAPLESTRLVAIVGAAALMLGCGIGVFMRNDLWNSPLDLWFQAASHAPNSAEVNRQMGRLHLSRAQSMMMALAQIPQQQASSEAAIQQERIREAFAAASRYLERTTELDPTDPEVFEMKGYSLSRIDELDQAYDAFYEALRLDPARPSTLRHIAATFHDEASQTGDMSVLASAVGYYEQAAQFERLPQEYQMRFALALAELGGLAQAETMLAPLVTDDHPEDSPLRQRLEGIRSALNQARALQSQVVSLLEEDPGAPELYRAQAQLSLMRRQYLFAFYYLDALLDQRPTDANSWVLLGYSRAQLDDIDGFLDERPQPPGMPGTHESAWMQLAVMCSMNGRWDAAEDYLSSSQARAVIDSPQQALAQVAVSLGQAGRAREYLTAAADARPEDPQPVLELSDLAAMVGDMTAARGYLGEAERRGASPQALEPRRARIAEQQEHEAERPPRAIIR